MSRSQLQTLTARITETTERLTLWGGVITQDASVRGDTDSYKGGDPRDTFHSIRQFLLQQGIDTRVFTFGSVALPVGLKDAMVTDDLGIVDNSFYFQFHRIMSLDNEDRINVNILIMIMRCFFQENPDGTTTLHAQLVINHDRDAVYELNKENDYLIGLAQSDGWTRPSTATNRVTFFEKAYTDMHEFKRFVLRLQRELQASYETT